MPVVTPRIAHSGPPLGAIAIVVTGLFMGSLLLPIALAGGHVFPSPYAAEATILQYFTAHPGAVRVSGLLQFAASLPLAIYAATASARLNRLGIRAPGAVIALAGGVLASGSMALSGLLTWALARPEVARSVDLVRLVHDLAFITGGPGSVVPLGLLLAGIAVPGLLAGLLPRRIAWAGLVIAGVAMVSTVAVGLPVLGFLLPVARFPALAWLIVAGFLLPLQRQNKTASGTPTAGQPS
ncbi:MAG: hypothetical protein QOG52_27 [Frankiaceae bacterium]|jgi:hypothetical protein|nr:hypothetical protein [Frankiaceae bacterium]